MKWWLLLLGIGVVVGSVVGRSSVSAVLSPRNSREERPSCSVLMHSFDGYRRYWAPWIYFFKLHYGGRWPVLVATESIKPDLPESMEWVSCRKGAWSDRLLEALDSVKTDYVLYIQEDMWLTGKVPANYLDSCLTLAKKKDLNLLKLQANGHHRAWGSIDGEGYPSWYVLSHQPGIWKVSYLRETLVQGESPYDHEIGWNQWIHAHPSHMPAFGAAVDHGLPAFPYDGVSIQGQLTSAGARMLQGHRLSWAVAEDEVTFRKREDTV